VPTPPQASVAVQPIAQVGTNMLAWTVSLSSQQWGTFISMNCVLPGPERPSRHAGDGCGRS